MLHGVNIIRAASPALSLETTRTVGRRSARCRGVELSQGWGWGRGCSAIQPEPSLFFLVAIFRLVSRSAGACGERLFASGKGVPRLEHTPYTPMTPPRADVIRHDTAAPWLRSKPDPVTGDPSQAYRVTWTCLSRITIMLVPRQSPIGRKDLRPDCKRVSCPLHCRPGTRIGLCSSAEYLLGRLGRSQWQPI